jgi:hypothetical protein
LSEIANNISESILADSMLKGIKEVSLFTQTDGQDYWSGLVFLPVFLRAVADDPPDPESLSLGRAGFGFEGFFPDPLDIPLADEF